MPQCIFPRGAIKCVYGAVASPRGVGPLGESRSRAEVFCRLISLGGQTTAAIAGREKIDSCRGK